MEEIWKEGRKESVIIAGDFNLKIGEEGGGGRWGKKKEIKGQGRGKWR